MKTLPRGWVLFWAVLAVAGIAGAALLGPWVIPPLDGKHEHFRSMMETGVILLRMCLAVSVVLSLLSLALWRRGESVLQEPQVEPSTRVGAWPAALILVLIVSALAIPRLSTTLWWDELTTLTRVVKRGPLVIMTFSCDANNHILNSLLIWASVRSLGEDETVLHLAPFLMSLATVQMLFWTLIRFTSINVAFLSGFAAATHPWLINHGVEARGYAGAVLFSLAATISFARLITNGSPRQTVLYVASCVISFGFISTTLLIPFAHGAAACLLLIASYRRKNLASYRSNAINAIFACLWIPLLAGLLFGIPLPQTLAYARDGAAKDHLLLGWPLGEEALSYVTGLRNVVPAAIFACVACTGWWLAFRRGSSQALRLFMFSSLLPLGAAVFYVLLPGTRSSSRFFCFLIVPVCCGVGMAVDWLSRIRTIGPVIVGLVMAVWLGLLTLEHQRLIVINRPNLKALSTELQGARVVLIGAQADVNIYYFTQCTIFQEGRSQVTIREALAGTDVVVEGRAGKDNRLEEPDEAIIALGFHVQQTLPSAIAGGTEYLVYRRIVRNE